MALKRPGQALNNNGPAIDAFRSSDAESLAVFWLPTGMSPHVRACPGLGGPWRDLLGTVVFRFDHGRDDMEPGAMGVACIYKYGHLFTAEECTPRSFVALRPID